MNADADFVRIETPQSGGSIMLNGVLYALELQFGSVGGNAFSSVDQFHVQEGANTTGGVEPINLDSTNEKGRL